MPCHKTTTAKTLPGRHCPCPEQLFNKAQLVGVVVELTEVVVGLTEDVVGLTEVVVGFTGVIVGITGDVLGLIDVSGGYPSKQSLLCQIDEHVQN